jgi:hypothetical protein
VRGFPNTNIFTRGYSRLAGAAMSIRESAGVIATRTFRAKTPRVAKKRAAPKKARLKRAS